MALVLKTVKPDMTAYNGFKYPVSGLVEAPDFVPHNRCGNGLHGALWGEGDGDLFSWDADAKWLVIEVPDETIIHGSGEMIGKCKFPRGNVIFVGDQKQATDFLRSNGGEGRVIIGATVTTGDVGTATAGYGGVAIAGRRGTATTGDRGTAIVGDFGVATAGYRGCTIAGYYGSATTGNYGSATAGYEGTATAGDCGVAITDSYGISVAGYCGTAIAGNFGTAIVGCKGSAKAGECGIIQIKFWDDPAQRYRFKIGYIGEEGLKPNVPYILDNQGKFVEKEPNKAPAGPFKKEKKR